MRLSVAPGLKDCNCNGVGGHPARRREVVNLARTEGLRSSCLVPNKSRYRTERRTTAVRGGERERRRKAARVL